MRRWNYHRKMHQIRPKAGSASCVSQGADMWKAMRPVSVFVIRSRLFGTGKDCGCSVCERISLGAVAACLACCVNPFPPILNTPDPLTINIPYKRAYILGPYLSRVGLGFFSSRGKGEIKLAQMCSSANFTPQAPPSHECNSPVAQTALLPLGPARVRTTVLKTPLGGSTILYAIQLYCVVLCYST